MPRGRPRKITPSVPTTTITTQTPPSEPMTELAVTPDEFVKSLSLEEAQGLVHLNLLSEVSSREHRYQKEIAGYKDRENELDYEITMQKDLIYSLKEEIKKLETENINYKKKFKEWNHDTDILIKALSDIRVITLGLGFN